MLPMNARLLEEHREKTQRALEALAKEAKQQDDSAGYAEYMSLIEQLNQNE